MADPAQPEPPVVLNSNGPAVVQWISSDGKTRCLGLQPSAKVHVHLHFDAASKTAFFKLRIPVILEPLLGIPTPLFLFVHPERIESLAQIQDARSDDLVNHLLKGRQASGSRLHLRVMLSRPADLVLPKAVTGKAFYDATARTQAVGDKDADQQTDHGNVAYLLMLLARASAFDIHGYLPSVREGSCANTIPAICEAVSAHTLSSNVASSDLVSLYGGKGAQVFEVSSDAPGYTESPPSYNEVASASTATAEAGSTGASSIIESKKRRRSTSPEDNNISEKHKHALEDVFSKLFQGAMLAMESRLENRMQDWVEVRLKQQAEEIRNVEGRMKDWLQGRLKQQADEMKRLADEQEHMRDHFDDEIQQVRNETDELCDVRIEDQMLSVKIECEEFVKDEIREAKRGIVQHFRSMANLFSDIDSELGDNG